MKIRWEWFSLFVHLLLFKGYELLTYPVFIKRFYNQRDSEFISGFSTIISCLRWPVVISHVLIVYRVTSWFRITHFAYPNEIMTFGQGTNLPWNKICGLCICLLIWCWGNKAGIESHVCERSILFSAKLINQQTQTPVWVTCNKLYFETVKIPHRKSKGTKSFTKAMNSR